MTAPLELPRLVALWRPISHLSQISGLLEWDQETMMPFGGAEGRAEHLATLASLRHGLLTSQQLWDAIEEAEHSDDPELIAQARRARRDASRARRLDPALAARLAATASRALMAWQEARRQGRFGVLAPLLSEMVSLKREQATQLAETVHAESYDALVDEYEPGVGCELIEQLFDPLLEELVPMVAEASRQPGVGSVLAPQRARGLYPADQQLELGRRALEAVGFDLSRGRIDSSAHPFCMGVHSDDVRITWRASELDFRPGLFGLLHEMGHALYEQGLPLELRDTPLGGAASVAVHESQSRLWENHVGRSHGFCRWLLPHLKDALPGAALRSAQELQLSLLEVRRSLIRVDADELTYHLHIVVRFRLERALIAAELEVDELPLAWNDAYRETLGIEPSGDLDGVLQDIHWACGLFGYFPTYTLGSLIAAQLFEAAERELGALDDAFAAGDFSALLGWLRSRVHAHGARLTAAQLVAHATGSALSIAPLLARARALAGAPAII